MSGPLTAQNMTTAQLRKALREGGVDIPEGADRSALEALHANLNQAVAAEEPQAEPVPATSGIAAPVEHI